MNSEHDCADKFRTKILETESAGANLVLFPVVVLAPVILFVFVLALMSVLFPVIV